MTLGPDVARRLRPVWPLIEAHAERLDRLVRQQANVTFAVVPGRKAPALAVNLPLTESHSVRVLLEGKEVRYYLEREGQLFQAEIGDVPVDQGVYLMLAELAAPD